MLNIRYGILNNEFINLLVLNYYTPLPLSRGERVVLLTRIGTFSNFQIDTFQNRTLYIVLRPEAKPNGAKLKSVILLKRCYNQQGQA
jgi:hypothetical protein